MCYIYLIGLGELDVLYLRIRSGCVILMLFNYNIQVNILKLPECGLLIVFIFSHDKKIIMMESKNDHKWPQNANFRAGGGGSMAIKT